MKRVISLTIGIGLLLAAVRSGYRGYASEPKVQAATPVDQPAERAESPEQKETVSALAVPETELPPAEPHETLSPTDREDQAVFQMNVEAIQEEISLVENIPYEMELPPEAALEPTQE